MPRPMISGPYRTFRRLNPDQSFLEFEGSTITIPMRGRRSLNDPWMEDEIQLQAFMRLEIYRPYLSNLGTREFQFTIRDWNLYGKSPMLNQLFFDDPRGYLVQSGKDKTSDYVPAVVTFNVNNHYHIGTDADFSPRAIFASEKAIEIRNLTSHDLRVWTRYPKGEREDWLYSQPSNRIYWQVLPGNVAANTGLIALVPEKERAQAANRPFIVFHKKPPPSPRAKEIEAFDAANDRDLAGYLLAAAVLDPKQGASRRAPAWVSATNPLPGLRANRAQIKGNTLLSLLYRPRDGVEIRFAMNPEMKPEELNGMVQQAASRAGTKWISGWIEIVSPARSLGAADQGPDVGAPIDSADFPARITYAINYNIFVNDTQFIEDQAGIAIADGCLEVPPRDVTVAFEKIHIGQVLEKYLEFDNGHCTGMHEITADDYHAGTNFARYWRTVPLALDGNWGAYEDYDPTKEY